MPILLCKTADNNVPESPGKWRAGEIVTAVADDHVFSHTEQAGAGAFHHIKVTDRTLEEAHAYMQAWNHEPETTQYSAVNDDRVLQVTSTMVSVSGQNAFTQLQVENFCTGLNDEFPTANASYNAHQNDSFRFNVTVQLAQRDALIERINDFVREVQYKRRRRYTTQAARDYLNANGGYLEGTAGQILPYLRDGLLD